MPKARVELFSKLIKQNLKITRFLGCSDNAIRSQIAVAFIAYLLVRLIQQAQPTLHRASSVLLIVRTHLVVRRPTAHLLDHNIAKPPGPIISLTQLRFPLGN